LALGALALEHTAKGEVMSWWAVWWKTKAGYERKCAVLAEARVEELTAELARAKSDLDFMLDQIAGLEKRELQLVTETRELGRRLGLAEDYAAYLRAHIPPRDGTVLNFDAFTSSLPAKPSGDSPFTPGGPCEKLREILNRPREWWASVRGVANAVDPHVGCLFTTKPESGGEVIRVREVEAKPEGQGEGENG
jgi:hypothetical protein